MKSATDMTKTATTHERVEHLLFGHGSVIESRITESGQSVRLVRFDASETERLILTDSLKRSSSAPVDSGEAPKKRKTKAAAPAKGTRHRRTASPPAEIIPDQLLVPALDDTVAETDPEREETETLEVLTFHDTKWTERNPEVITRSD